MYSQQNPILGTALTPHATKVMLLGSGELGKEVIISLQRLGVEVIAVDRYEQAPGHQLAHRHYTIDMADGVALKKLLNTVKPDIVVPEIEAIATDVLIEFEASQKGLVTPTANAAKLTMNREGIRRLVAEELQLPTSNYAFADTYEEFTQAVSKIGLPCIVKPIMSSSGKGQSKITDITQLESAWENAQNNGRNGAGRVIVESFIRFEYEITLLTVRALNSHGDIETKFCEPIGHVQVDGDYVESWQPQSMSERSLHRARQIAQAVTNTLGGLGVFGVELFIAGDNVWFSEVSPRPHDTGMVTMITQYQSEFELHARALLGLPIDTRLRQAGASSVIYGGCDSKDISFEHVAKALHDLGTEVRLFGKPESFIKRRMGVALAVADTVTAARNKAKRVSATIQVLNNEAKH